MKIKYLALFLITLPLFLITKTSLAVDSSSSAAAKYNLTFPIAQLGNCSDLASCKKYCDDKKNREACTLFSKQKGLDKRTSVEIKKPPLPQASVSIYEAAGKALGCTNEASCKEFCGNFQNWEKCGEFAKRFKMGTAVPKPSNDPCTQLKEKMASQSATAESVKAYYQRYCLQSAPPTSGLVQGISTTRSLIESVKSFLGI